MIIDLIRFYIVNRKKHKVQLKFNFLFLKKFKISNN